MAARKPMMVQPGHKKPAAPLAPPSGRGYARAGRAGVAAPPQGEAPDEEFAIERARVEEHGETEVVSRETIPDTDAEAEAKNRQLQTDVSVCNIVRRQGFMLRTLLDVWKGTLRRPPTDRQKSLMADIEAATDVLVTCYGEPPHSSDAEWYYG